MTVFETERFAVRQFTEADATFIVELVNDPAWLHFIGDRGVRTPDDARAYLTKGPLAMYARHGFGLYCVTLRADGTPIGMCGLLKRDTLPDVDIGFAFLPQFRGQGYALEAARATLAHGRTALGLGRIVAITHPDNHDSARLLEKLGLKFERLIQMPGYAGDSKLFGPADSPPAA